MLSSFFLIQETVFFKCENLRACQ